MQPMIFHCRSDPVMGNLLRGERGIGLLLILIMVAVIAAASGG